MMRSTIANFKENLNQIALEVHDAAEELDIYRSNAGEDSSVSDRRSSHRFAQSKSPLRSPTANGFDSGFKHEIEQYKAEVERLKSSENEIKALSVNYAALLKEKEEQLSRLHEENNSLRKNLETTNATRHLVRSESSKTLTSNPNVLKGTRDQLLNIPYRLATQVNTRSTGNNIIRGNIPKQDTLSNGSPNARYDGIRNNRESKYANFQVNEVELAGLLEEHSRTSATMQADYESQIEQLRMELNKEHDSLKNVQLKLQEEHNLNGSFQKELFTLKMENDKCSGEMQKLQNELNEKISETKRLQSELTRRDTEEEADEIAESLKIGIASLEKENTNLKAEKNEIEAALKINGRHYPDENFVGDSDFSTKHSNNLNEVHSSKSFHEKEAMEELIKKLENDLKEVYRERDKALQELTRLKQHLLDKEHEESDKIDEDSKMIEELRENCEYQRNQIIHLEKALKQAIADQEEVKKINSDDLQKSKKKINDLEQKLANCMSTIDAKNVELLNLQTALGQYYAESEAKGRLERDLAHAREESTRISELLKDANERAEILKREREEILVKFSQAEQMASEGNQTVHKLEADNSKLRRALEQSMTRLNRMSLDSDYFVDRRIVIKLLVTYFQRNHSKEVLDLMVRMLGFSEEEKQRIGLAQQGLGKGVVKGVLGLPGRLVGGILGGSSAEVSSHLHSENQSFSDLWVDFLLKETEVREKRESLEGNRKPEGDKHQRIPSGTGAAASVPDHRTTNMSSLLEVGPSANQSNLMQPEHLDTIFTVPLTPSVSPYSETRSRTSIY